MGLFRSARLPEGSEVLRSNDAESGRRWSLVLLAIVGVLAYVLTWVSAQHTALYEDFVGPLLLTIAGLLLLVAPFMLFAKRHSEFVVLDGRQRRFVLITDDQHGERHTSVRFADVAEIVVEKDTVRESDGYSEVDHIRYSLVTRTTSGNRYVLAEPVKSTDLSMREPPDLCVLRDRLRAVVAGRG